METNIPEGLQHQPASTIARWIASNGFNCVRLTFSIDMAISSGVTVATSFTNAAAPAGVSVSAMQSLYAQVVAKNPWIGSTTTTRNAFEQVIRELAGANVMVVLDNHVSRAGWCCGMSDGNGWWASASGYNADNSRYFDTGNWLAGLRSMAALAAAHPNVVGLALRNELRAAWTQDWNGHADWYSHVEQGGAAVLGANPNLLIIVGGVGYATDFTFIYDRMVNRTFFGNKLVWEYHNYAWSGIPAGDCAGHQKLMGDKAGYLLAQGKVYTAPLFVSEFGWAQRSPSPDESAYAACLVNYLEGNDADWAYWALAGSYYVRDATVNSDESFGLLTSDWGGWRNATFRSTLGRIWEVTQGP